MFISEHDKAIPSATFALLYLTGVMPFIAIFEPPRAFIHLGSVQNLWTELTDPLVNLLVFHFLIHSMQPASVPSV